MAQMGLKVVSHVNQSAQSRAHLMAETTVNIEETSIKSRQCFWFGDPL